MNLSPIVYKRSKLYERVKKKGCKKKKKAVKDLLVAEEREKVNRKQNSI